MTRFVVVVKRMIADHGNAIADQWTCEPSLKPGGRDLSAVETDRRDRARIARSWKVGASGGVTGGSFPARFPRGIG